MTRTTTVVAVALTMLVVGLAAHRLRPPPSRVRAARRPAGADQRAWPRARPRVRRRRYLAAGTAVVLAALAWPPLGLVTVALLLAAPRWKHRRARRRLVMQIRSGLPDVVDLLAVAVAAGLTPTLAVARLSSLAGPPFDAAFSEVTRRMGHGARLGDALGALHEHLGEPVRPIVAAITASDRYGMPLAPALDLLAHESRRERRRHAEEAARTLPVKLCFPLVCCTLPAFGLLTIAPLVAGALGSLHL